MLPCQAGWLEMEPDERTKKERKASADLPDAPAGGGGLPSGRRVDGARPTAPRARSAVGLTTCQECAGRELVRHGRVRAWLAIGN